MVTGIRGKTKWGATHGIPAGVVVVKPLSQEGVPYHKHEGLYFGAINTHVIPILLDLGGSVFCRAPQYKQKIKLEYSTRFECISAYLPVQNGRRSDGGKIWRRIWFGHKIAFVFFFMKGAVGRWMEGRGNKVYALYLDTEFYELHFIREQIEHKPHKMSSLFQI